MVTGEAKFIAMTVSMGTIMENESSTEISMLLSGKGKSSGMSYQIDDFYFYTFLVTWEILPENNVVWW